MSNAFRDTKFLHRNLFGADAERKNEYLAKRNIKKQKKILTEAEESIKSNSILLLNEPGYIKTGPGEKSFKLTQAELIRKADIGTQRKAFTLKLGHGPYIIDYTQNGRHMLIGGEKGQLSLIDTHTMKQHFEICVRETVRDVKFLHSHEMVAIAQKKYVYIYDNNGSEVYCLRDRMLTYKLEYLYYHYLLVGIGKFGELVYQDVSTGEIAARLPTRKGACNVMSQNKQNAIIHLGHNDGIVSLWVPNIEKECVQLLAHKGPLTAMSVYGNYMVTAGFDGYWKVWDLRNYKESLKKEFVGSTPPCAMDISQTGILSMALGCRIEFYADLFRENGLKKPKLYLTHQIQSQIIKGIKFQYFEDVCAVGSTFGISTLLVPGSGFANFDSLEHDPYNKDKNRQVQRLLDKIPADTITLNTQAIGSYSRDLSLPDGQYNEDLNEEIKASKKRKRKKLPNSSALKKAKMYMKTFKRRQQAVADRIKNLRKGTPSEPDDETKEKVLKGMSVSCSDDKYRIKGPVKGAALSRYFKKHSKI